MPTKRFYCTVCKKVKRVRVLPAVVDTPMSPNPANRVGECDRHSRVFTPRPIVAVQKRAEVVVSTPRPTTKKGRK